MTDKNKATQTSGQSLKITHADSNHNRHSVATTKPAPQIERVLLALLYNGSLNCQEAEKFPIKARHLNSVISELANYHGLEIDRVREVATGYQGEHCNLIRYRVYHHQQAKAWQLIEQWRLKRRASPIAWPTLRTVSLEQLLRTT